MKMFALLILSLVASCPAFSINHLIGQGSSLKSNLDTFLKNLQKDSDFETLLLMNSFDETDPITKFSFDYPVLRLTEIQSYYLHGNYNNRLVAIILLSNKLNESLTGALADNLHHMRQVRIIFVVKFFTRQIINDMLEYCEKNEMIHVIFLTESNLRVGDYYYRLKPFPYYRIVKKKFGNSHQYFLPNITLDFEGLTLMTLPDQYEGRSMIYKDLKTGKLTLSGYVGKLIYLFTKQYNLNMQYLYPVKPDQHINALECLELTRNYSIPLAISLFRNIPRDNHGEFSYPVELIRWFIIIPCARPLPLQAIFTIVINSKLCIVMLFLYFVFSSCETLTAYIFRKDLKKSLAQIVSNFIINERILPGIIGLPFKLPKSTMLNSLRLIYQLICIIGLIISTLIIAQHKTLLTSRPLEKQIMSYDDMRRMAVKLLIFEFDVPFIEFFQGFDYLNNIKDIVEYSHQKSSYSSQRRTFNTSYAYTMTSAVWPYYRHQQEFFTHPLFCETPFLVISTSIYMSVPLKANSVFTASLDNLISLTHDFGLMDYWRRSTFYEMVSLGKFRLNDLNPAESFRAFRLSDLNWAWFVFAKGMALCVFIFFFELLIFHFNRIKFGNTITNN